MAAAKRDLDRMDAVTENDNFEERKIEVTGDLISQTKITDLNQFCLEHIFIHLDLEDLLNVADANKYLRLATHVPFVRNYAGKSVQFELSKTHGYGSDVKIIMIKFKTEFEKDVIIVDFKTTFQMLRCFGGMITDLEIRYYNTHRTDIYPYVLYYLYNFCSTSLTKLKLGSLSFFEVFDQFKKPFSNVEELYINNISNWKKLYLSRVFPKLCRLYFHICDKNNYSEYFPYLNHLDLGNCSSDSKVDNLLQLNPHLRSLKFRFVDYIFLDGICEYLQFIESLDIRTYEIQTSPIYHFQNVQKFKIELYLSDHYQTVSKIPFLFNQLKELEIESYDFLDYSDFFITFLNENRMIEKLSFNNASVFLFIVSDELEDALPSLKDIIYTKFNGSKKEIIEEYLPYLDFLRSFSFITTDIEDTDVKISELCVNKWRVHRTRITSEYSEVGDLVRLEHIELTI